MKKIPSFALIAGLIFPPIPSVVNAQNECSWGTNSQQRVFAHEDASITVSTGVPLASSLCARASSAARHASSSVISA